MRVFHNRKGGEQMKSKEDQCEHCGCLTTEGKRKSAEQYKLRPIFDTDFSKPLTEIIEGVRTRLIAARGTLADIGFAYSGWSERTKDVEGLITCGLVTLYGIKEKMEEVETIKQKLEGDK